MTRKSWTGAEAPYETPAKAPELVAKKAPEAWRLVLGTRASHYGAARLLHGWSEHEHHQGEPMQLTEAAYTEAVREAMKMPPTPSPNALSPHRGKGK